jgi:hypothetical protein
MQTPGGGANRKPWLERFGSLRELTRVGCTLGGDGIWICSTPQSPDPSPPGNANR